MADPLWYRNAVFYEVYVRAFCDANGDGQGDLKGLTQKLDYLRSLGVDCIWLLPIYPSPLRDDGYDISDFRAIHPAYGNLDDFDALLEASHARGIRVIMDLVLNHTSDQHAWFQEARRGPTSPFHDYYVWSDDPERYRQARIIFVDTQTSNWTWDETAGQYFWHRFYSFQPDLNYDNPAVQAEMLGILRFWLQRGVDGFRVDAVPYLFEREGTNCENLPETHAFLKQMRSFVDAEFPGRILLAEANQRPRDLVPYFGLGDEVQMAFHFPLMPRIFEAIRKGQRAPIVDVLGDTPPLPASNQWCTFLRNHDELTLEMVSPEEREWMWREYAPDRRMRLNLGIRRRLAPLLDGDRRKIELAYSLLFSLPGAPILYYGDEIGMGDDLRLADRRGLRTPMQWDASSNAGFSLAKQLFTPVIEEKPYGYRKVNVAAQIDDPGSLWRAVHRLVVARQSLAFSSPDAARFLEAPSAVLGVMRPLQNDVFLGLHNLSPDPQHVDLPALSPASGKVATILGSGLPSLDGGGTLALDLEPYGYAWFRGQGP